MSDSRRVVSAPTEGKQPISCRSLERSSASYDPSAICQQTHRPPAASGDRREYVCFISPITLQTGTAAHLETGFPIYPARERKRRRTESNLTEPLVSCPPAATPLGHTDASLPVPLSLWQQEEERGTVSDGQNLLCSSYILRIKPKEKFEV